VSCEYCGRAVPEHATSCPHCEAPLEDRTSDPDTIEVSDSFRIGALEERVARIESRALDSQLLDPSKLLRSFAVFGHLVLASFWILFGWFVLALFRACTG
jgi:hypothetical protein